VGGGREGAGSWRYAISSLAALCLRSLAIALLLGERLYWRCCGCARRQRLDTAYVAWAWFRAALPCASRGFSWRGRGHMPSATCANVLPCLATTAWLARRGAMLVTGVSPAALSKKHHYSCNVSFSRCNQLSSHTLHYRRCSPERWRTRAGARCLQRFSLYAFGTSLTFGAPAQRAGKRTAGAALYSLPFLVPGWVGSAVGRTWMVLSWAGLSPSSSVSSLCPLPLRAKFFLQRAGLRGAYSSAASVFCLYYACVLAVRCFVYRAAACVTSNTTFRRQRAALLRLQTRALSGGKPANGSSLSGSEGAAAWFATVRRW